ncbi:MAG: ABC transporter substrate-binding protein [Synergistaceae bacterium]|nr:ABC transporter substrate-binding protein [Synergistaceae bacterium]
MKVMKVSMKKLRRLAAVLLWCVLSLFSAGGIGEGAAPLAGKGAQPLRVISLYPGHTDNVLALGGTLVGISENDAPDVLPGAPRFPLKTGAEPLLALRPDIVLTRSMAERMNPNLSSVLTRAGVRVISLDPPSWDEFPDYLRRLAEVLGLEPEAGVKRLSALRASIAERAREALASGKRPARVFVEATARELHTCAPKSWAARLVELAGGVNVAAAAVPLREGSAIAPWGLERVLRSLNEGVDVYIVQRGAMNAATPEDVRARPWAGALAGVEIAGLPEADLSRPSLPGLERGGEALLRIFYGGDRGAREN